LLALKPHQLPHLVWRLDGGFGSDDALNWLLARNSQVLVKGYNSRRADKVVQEAGSDDWLTVRARKWAKVVPTRVRYGRRVQTIALHWITAKGKPKNALLLHTLWDEVLLQVLQYYDARGGTLESDLHQDKLGLQLIRRRKHCWYAQEAWVILTDIAHNLLVWVKDWMFAHSRFERYGMLRLVQDVFSLPGTLEFKGDRLHKVSLLRTHPYAPEILSCVEHLFRELS